MLEVVNGLCFVDFFLEVLGLYLCLPVSSVLTGCKQGRSTRVATVFQ